MEIKRVGVLGCGLMGSGIAQTAASAGFETTVREVTEFDESFDDLWRPLLITLAASMVLAVCEQVFRGLAPYSVYTVMTGEVYFRTGQLPWIGLLASLAASAALLYSAAINIARRDF